jgi:hypothetical protein
MAGTIILSTAYGINVQPKDDPFLALAERFMEGHADAARPGVYLVDSLPWLRYVPSWFPGANFKRKAQRYRKAFLALPEMPMQYAKSSFVRSVNTLFYDMTFELALGKGRLSAINCHHIPTRASR